MNRRPVKRIDRSPESRIKPIHCSYVLAPSRGTFCSLLAVIELPFFLAVFHDVLGCRRINARHVGEK